MFFKLRNLLEKIYSSQLISIKSTLSQLHIHRNRKGQNNLMIFFYNP